MENAKRGNKILKFNEQKILIFHSIFFPFHTNKHKINVIKGTFIMNFIIIYKKTCFKHHFQN